MEWDDVKFALAVARGGTLSAAGAALGVSHTTVSRRLQRLESALGARLFDRAPGGLVATAAGTEAIAAGEAIERRIHELDGRVLGRDTRLSGPLRVTTMDLFLLRYHEAFASFAHRFPDIDLTVTSSNEEASLRRREADVALRMTDAPPEYLIGQRVGRERFALYGQTELVECSGGPDASWASLPWLSWDERMDLRFLDAFIERRAPGHRVVMRVDFDSVLLREAIARGLGVHFLACADADEDPRLTRIGTAVEEFERDVWLLTMPELQTNPRVRSFIDHMADAIRDP